LKGFGGFLIKANVAEDLTFEIGDRGEDATINDVALKLTEPALHLIQPRRIGRRLREVSEVIRQITESAAKVKMLADEVSLGGQEQARGNEQIARTGPAAGYTADSSERGRERIGKSPTEKAPADSMQDIVATLEMLVSGGR